MTFYTIGVYNSSESDFFQKLIDNKIDTFIDIRQRRGVRGSKYKFVNSNRLQQRLIELEIKYAHIIGLAPTTAIRELQKITDTQRGELKHDRLELGLPFKNEYANSILKKFDFDLFLKKLNDSGSNRIVFFCVEEKPESCHRSIVTEHLRIKYNKPSIHL